MADEHLPGTDGTAAAQPDALLEAVTLLIPVLLRGVEGLGRAGRHLEPTLLEALAGEVGTLGAPLAAALAAFEAQDWPAGLEDFRGCVAESATRALAGIDRFAAAPTHAQPLMAAYRALGQHWRALEALYPVAAMLPPVSRFFLNERARGDPTLAARLAESAGTRERGVMHADNAPDQRGGFSLYVPEHAAPGVPLPLVVALHGGSGHGRGFLWSWLRDARSAGCLLLAPTSQGATWPLMEDDQDAAAIRAMIEAIDARWPIDRARVLLTGMSDGATYSWLAGLAADAPFTHLAPACGTFHPLLLEAAGPDRLPGLPVYLVHGARDWMFPVDVARLARDALTAAGAAVVYREIEDLSHVYPVEENVRILDWLMQAPQRPGSGTSFAS